VPDVRGCAGALHRDRCGPLGDLLLPVEAEASAVALVISGWMKPGAIALAVTPNVPSSLASVLVKTCSPALTVA
jgi:hypothetical protein